jgi:pteridine reductase
MTTNATPIALVTGGARRVGAAVCRALAEAGYHIIITYNTSAEAAARLADELPSAEVSALPLDDPQRVQEWGGELAGRIDRLDALVHNASIYEPTELDELDAAKVRRFYDVNAASPLLLTGALAPLLKRSRGAIVAMTDIHALGLPRVRYSAYAMSKAALAEMVRSLARDLAPDVRVNAVAPGVVAWPAEGPESDERAQQAYLDLVPLARPGTVEDAAEAVRWLIMDATYLTGQTIRVDGGRSLR